MVNARWFSRSLLLVLLVSIPSPALGQTKGVLTNADVVKMVQAQLAPGIIRTTIESADCSFDVSPAGLIALKEAGVPDEIIQAMQGRARARESGAAAGVARGAGPEKSELLAEAKDKESILRTFKTLAVDASHAGFFGTEQMKAALGRNKGFPALNIIIVDDPAVADVVLSVGYTFAWDYPFSLQHQNTSMVLVSGKGSGPFSGPKGASSVASELVKLLKPYRTPAAKRGTEE